MKAKTTILFSICLAAVVVLTGCTPIAPPPVSTVPTTEANIALARRVFEEIWNEGALDVADEVFSPDVTYIGLIGNMPPGPESYKQYVAGYRAILPDIHYTIDDAIAQGDKVLLRWSGPATQMGELMGAPPSGKTAFVTGMFLCRIEEGKIVETWANFDALGMFMQYGFQLVPPMVEAVGDPTIEMESVMKNTNAASQIFEELWNKGNMEVAGEIIADNAVFYGLAAPLPPGPDAYAQYVASWRDIFPDIHYIIENVITMDDLVTIRWSATGTHEGELMGVPGTGNWVEITGMNTSRMADGKIVESWSNFDVLGLFQQVGFQLIPPAIGSETMSEDTDGILRFSTFGDGPEKVIAIHNFWDNQQQYEPLLPYLDPQAYTFVFLDLRGYGASKEIQGEFTAEEAASDIIALADHLGWDRFHLVGHSMSGMIVQRVALEATDRVKSIVALTPVPATGAQLDEATTGFFASVIADRQSTYDYFRMTIPMFSASYAEFRTARSWESASPEVKLGYLDMWNSTDFSQETKGLETPMLVVLGEYDADFNQLVIPFWETWYPNCEIITSANATHHITEDTPVFVASAIQDFLDQYK